MLLSRFSLVIELKSNERAASEELDNDPENVTRSCPLASTHTHTHMRIYIHKNTHKPSGHSPVVGREQRPHPKVVRTVYFFPLLSGFGDRVLKSRLPKKI